MGRAAINYKKNEIRLTVVNFLTGAFLYLYLAGELTGGKNIFSYHENTVLFILFAGECAFCAGSIIVAFYQRQYNQHLAETNSGINRWFLSERAFNYLTAIITLLIGWYLLTIPLTETRSGLATGGLFFENQRFADAPDSYRQLIYFHFALCILPFACGAWLLIFPPRKAERFKIELKIL